MTFARFSIVRAFSVFDVLLGSVAVPFGVTLSLDWGSYSELILSPFMLVLSPFRSPYLSEFCVCPASTRST